MDRANSLSPDDSASSFGQGLPSWYSGVPQPGSVDFIGEVAKAIGAVHAEGYDLSVVSKLTGEDLRMYFDRVDASRDKTQARICALAHTALRGMSGTPRHSPTGSRLSFGSPRGPLSSQASVVSGRDFRSSSPRSARSAGSSQVSRSSLKSKVGGKAVGWCYLDLVREVLVGDAMSLGEWPMLEELLDSPSSWFSVPEFSGMKLKGTGSRVHVVRCGSGPSVLDQLAATAAVGADNGRVWSPGSLGEILVPVHSGGRKMSFSLSVRVGGVVDSAFVWAAHRNLGSQMQAMLAGHPGAPSTHQAVSCVMPEVLLEGPTVVQPMYGSCSFASGKSVEQVVIPLEEVSGVRIPLSVGSEQPLVIPGARVVVNRMQSLVIPSQSVMYVNSVPVDRSKALVVVGGFASLSPHAVVDIVPAPDLVGIPAWVVGRHEGPYTVAESVRECGSKL